MLTTMDMDTDRAGVAAAHDLRSSMRIDAVAVDSMLEEVFGAMQTVAANRGVGLEFEVIAWEPLCVAADRAVLAETLRDLTRYVLGSTEDGSVTLTACPTHDDIQVMFEIKNSTPARRRSDLVTDPFKTVQVARARMESMSGTVAEYWSEKGGTRVLVTLPQWV